MTTNSDMGGSDLHDLKIHVLDTSANNLGNAERCSIPRMMTIRQVAKTGILPETAIRTMVKDGTIPAIYSGCKAFINFDQLCKMLNRLCSAS